MSHLNFRGGGKQLAEAARVLLLAEDVVEERELKVHKTGISGSIFTGI